MIREVISLAWRSVYSNKLRSGITIAIISLGIMALIGITTAIEAMNQSLRESFALLGANSFVIRFKDFQTDFNNSSYEKKSINGKIKKAIIEKPISKSNAEYFKNNFHFPNCKVGIWRNLFGQTIYFQDKETSPQIRVIGGDENYISINGYQLLYGRNINTEDVTSARYVCILGASVVNKLFDGNYARAVGKTIKVGTIKYLVIGTLKEKGTSSQMRADDMILTSYNNLRYLSGLLTNQFGFSRSNTITYTIGVETPSFLEMTLAMYKATAILRNIRQLRPVDADNFVLVKSDKFAELFIGFLSSITGASSLIGLITLISAAISLMNIMLVSVNERNREVGLIKALGGKKSFIRNQFLSESIIISILGAIFGIFIGVLLGNSVALILDTKFVIPWVWISIGIMMCTVVGLLAGLYPAVKASKLNPIEVLRSE